MLKKRPFFPLVYLLLTLLLIFQSACTQITVESSSPIMTPTSPVSGATPTPYVPASPSVATADPKKDICTHPVTLAVGEDGRITYQGISFILPPELGRQAEAWTCPFVYIDPNDFQVSHPPFVAFLPIASGFSTSLNCMSTALKGI